MRETNIEKAFFTVTEVPHKLNGLYENDKVQGDRGMSILKGTKDNGIILSNVSSNYTLVTNKEVIDTVVAAMNQSGLVCSLHELLLSGVASCSRMRARYLIPEAGFKIKDDYHNMFFEVINSYDTSAAYSIRFGVYRMICSNGAIVSKALYSDRKKHVGEIDLVEKFLELTASIEEAIEVTKNKFQEMANKKISAVEMFNSKKVKSLFGEAGQKEFNSSGMIPKYIEELGLTEYSLFNAVTDYLSNGTSLALTRRLELQEQILNKF